MKVTINRTAGDAPRKVVEAIVGGQAYPFVVSLTHSNILPVVLPSSGINTVLEAGKAYDVKVKSFHQAWHLVTDLSEYAVRTDNNADDYAVVTTAAEEPAPLPVATEVALAEAPAPDAIDLATVKPPAETKGTKEKVK